MDFVNLVIAEYESLFVTSIKKTNGIFMQSFKNIVIVILPSIGTPK